jgi:DNA-binding transcriptional LysR family regulator
MIPFSIKQLEAFAWVAVLSSFRKAASQLNTTQPAVSSRIASLEEALQTKLFERLSNSVRLTAKGQQLLPFAQRMLRMADKLQTAANSLAETKGVLRLGVSETIVHTWFSDFLKEFHESYPRIDVDVVVDVTVNLRSELISRRLDLAILLGPISEYPIGNIEMPSFPLAWACAPQLKLPEKDTISLCDLLRFPIITYARTTRPFSELYRKLSNDFEEPPRMFPAN